MSNKHARLAVLQVADTGPLESLVIMLQSVGYECALPDRGLRDLLRTLGCDTVLEIDDLVRNWGYDEPIRLKTVSVRDLDFSLVDLLVDVKAQRNGPLIWKHWPEMRERTLWYRINGGAPEHVIRADGFDCGDEVNPPCPVLTPNRWYADPGPWTEKSYSCWPPFYRLGFYSPGDRHPSVPPICLIHNLAGWGYGAMIPSMKRLGVRLLGRGSPDGLLPHYAVVETLHRTMAMVHLKSSDAPGYALYEALAAACPVIVPRRLIWRSRMQELFVPGETCLVFDRETHDALSEQDVAECTREIREALERLRDPIENCRIGEAGNRRLLELMWNDKNPQHVESLRQFMERHFR